MSSRDDMTLPAAKPRSRKSLGAIPSANALNKENMTMDIGSLMGGSSKRNPLGERQSKKSRSRSIGPGGLDALKESTGNKRKPMALAPKSILKPTISPLRPIPSRRVSPKATRSNNDMDPFVIPTLPPMNRVALRTEEEQQATAREREAEEKKAELIARRDARRKSLASRRVSFAPEATLHTWDVVEYVGDSTTSSNSTNGTRRQSGMSDGTIGSPSTPSVFHSDGSEAPSTPDQSGEGSMSPEAQRGLHQKKRRRSSGIPPLDFNNPDDEFFSSSPSGFGSSPDGAVVDDDFDDDDDESDSDGDGTAMSMDMGDATDTMASVRSFASDDSSGRLDKALRLAAQQAGTQGIDFDEHGPGAPEEEEEEETEELISFKPWSKKAVVTPSLEQENINPFSPAFHDGAKLLGQDGEQTDGEATMTMEVTRAMGGILQAPQPEESEDDQTMEMTMTMDMTKAVGRIMLPQREPIAYPALPQPKIEEEDQTMETTMDMTRAVGRIMPGQAIASPAIPQPVEEEDQTMEMTMDITMAMGGIIQSQPPPAKKRRQSVAPAHKSTRRVSAVSSTDNSGGDETMEFTMVMGGIQHAPPPPPSAPSAQEDDTVEMTMDITRAMGGILQAPQPEEIEDDQTMDMTMDMTRAVGGRILSSENVNPFSPAFHDGLKLLGQDQTETMEITRAVGRILPPNPAPPPKMRSFSPQSEEDQTMDMTMDMTKAVGRIMPAQRQPIEYPALPQLETEEEDQTMEMTMDMTRAVGRIVPGPAPPPKKRSPTPQTEDDKIMSMAVDMTTAVGRIMPGQPKTPTPKSSPARSKKTPTLSANPPSSSMKPPARKTPEPQPTPAKKSLPDMMTELNEAMTPKKKVARMQSPIRDAEEKSENYRPLKGRKSLHVGAAKGILGKRPVELDEHDNTDDEGGTKRLKNFQGSPVKNVKLQKPPVKEELTGRLTRAQRKSLEASNDDTLNIMKTPTKQKTPSKTPQKTAKTPSGQDRFMDAEKLFPEARTPVPFKVDTTVTIPLTEEPSSAPAIQIPAMKLQDFLDMTSIRFMELTTTKRRHTVAPNSLKNTEETSTLDNSLESCVVAGACTLPMLELFQHSCHELKRYISEGRKVVKEIEQETAEDNPPLFGEYVLANPDMRSVMDTQFNTVKANARLLSKGMWYEWRRELLKGLRAGLVKIGTGFDKDIELFDKQQELLDSVLPELEAKFTALVEEEELLKASAEEIRNSNPEDLAEARECLVGLNADNSSKAQMIEQLRAQIAEKDAGILKAEQRKTFCIKELREAEHIRQECRGWSSSEVRAIKARVDALEKQYRWTITGVQGSVVSMALKGELECVFDAAGFKNAEQHFGPQHMENSRIDLWYIAANREVDPAPLTEEKKFFVDGIRDYIRGLSQQDTTIKQLLDGIRISWETSNNMLDEIKKLNKAYPVIVEKTGDESIVVKSSMLLKGLRSKVIIDYHITTGTTVNGDKEKHEEKVDLGKDVSGGEGLQVRVKVDAKAVYGESFNEESMGRFLNRGVGEERSWIEVVRELEGRLIARGKK